LKSEKTDLQTSCLEAYEEGFTKAMHQAPFFFSSLDVNKSDLDKYVVDGQLVDD